MTDFTSSYPRPQLLNTLYKIRRSIREWLQATPFYALTLISKPPRHLPLVPPDPWPGDAQKGSSILQGKFLIAHNALSLSELWMPKGYGPDVLSRLHSFEWLRDLRAVGDSASRRLARQLVGNWIVRNKRWNGLAWQVDILAERLTHWISLHDFFCASADETFQQIFLRAWPVKSSI